MSKQDLQPHVSSFLQAYDAAEKDKVWTQQSKKVRDFLNHRVLSNSGAPLADQECDEIIKILDRNGKGNTKDSEAIARAMIPQGKWRKMFAEFRSDPKLGGLLMSILEAQTVEQRADRIDELYKFNQGRKNNLTGPSGNAVSIFLAAHDPLNNLSMISLGDRQKIIAYLGLSLSFDWDSSSIGRRIAFSNEDLKKALGELGVAGSARTKSVFCYFDPVQALWKGEHKVKRIDKTITVTVDPDDHTGTTGKDDAIRESHLVQGNLCKIAEKMGLKVWLPKADRKPVLKVWKPAPGVLLAELPMNYDGVTLKIIEQIDVLWINKQSIVRAFEVEHTTAVYSGLLRMADLLALQPNMKINLHIVAPEERKEKVFREISRPVFSLLEGGALSETCTYISYDSVESLLLSEHLAHMTDSVLGEYEETVDL